jgi:hypothetical protein
MSKQKTSRDSGEIDPPDLRIYRLKITLGDTDPPIWRRLEVYAGIEMDSRATAIDTVFGWSGEHLGEFRIKGRTIGDDGGWNLDEPNRLETQLQQLRMMLNSRASKEEKRTLGMDLFDKISAKLPAVADTTEPDEADVPTLSDLVPCVRTKFTYIYDFGDDWKHFIEVEKIAPAEPDVRCPCCTDGERANPIEDCGGPWGFADVVAAAGHPKHERFGDLLEWGLAKWDPAKFSVEESNRKLARLFRLKK